MTWIGELANEYTQASPSQVGAAILFGGRSITMWTCSPVAPASAVGAVAAPEVDVLMVVGDASLASSWHDVATDATRASAIAEVTAVVRGMDMCASVTDGGRTPVAGRSRGGRGAVASVRWWS